MPSAEESRDRLQRAGWSVTEEPLWRKWMVTGTNGDHRVQAVGRTRAEAWWRACLKAHRAGLLAPVRES
jgi:hypothetical protein